MRSQGEGVNLVKEVAQTFEGFYSSSLVASICIIIITP